MKYRIKLTVRDYYDYVGTNPYYSKFQRVKDSIPYEFTKTLYNLKYKIIKSKRYGKWYRVSFSVKMTESEILSVLDSYKDCCHSLENVVIHPLGCNVH